MTMEKVFTRPQTLKATPFHYCPGCGHSIAHRLIAEVIDELKLKERVLGIPPPGCSVFAHHYFDIDMAETAHGRGLAVGTGIKRVSPETVVFTYQGDGDLAAIGTAETIHAANRGERLTTIFINNANYGMTGGQMAPTTLLGQKTTTTPFGRDSKIEGYPLRISEMVALTEGAVYVTRCAVCSPVTILKTQQAIRKAFQVQLEDKGFALVEILSPCPTNWKMTPREAWQWTEKEMTRVFPLGLIKDTSGLSDAD
jgi:2-oxoglutarate ferredoxin oxidoreductase subunit beta